MQSVEWDIKIESFWQANDDEEAFFGFVDHRDPHPTPTYKPHVWGCELEENRTFRFWVSDHRDLGSKEPFKLRFVAGEELEAEWNGALARFWRERERVEEMKRVARELKSFGFGSLTWLKEQDASGRELDEDGEEDGGEDVDAEELEDQDWYFLGEPSAEKDNGAERGQKRKDSGGGKDVVPSRRSKDSRVY
jgi:hypothetical protein